MKDAHEMLQHLAEFAKFIFDKQDETVPMWLLIGSDGSYQPIMTPFHNDEEKRLSVEFVREKAAEMGATICGFMCEAWVVSVDKDDKEAIERVKKIPPSDHINREEVIQIFAEDNTGTSLAGLYHIIRPKTGAPSLSEFETMDGKITGPFTGIIQTRKLH